MGGQVSSDTETQNGEAKDAEAIGRGFLALGRRAWKGLRGAITWRLAAAGVVGLALGNSSGSGCALRVRDGHLRRDIDTLKTNVGILLSRSDQAEIRRQEYELIQERMPGYDRARQQLRRERLQLQRDSLRLHGSRPVGSVTRKQDSTLLATRRP